MKKITLIILIIFLFAGCGRNRNTNYKISHDGHLYFVNEYNTTDNCVNFIYPWDNLPYSICGNYSIVKLKQKDDK